MTSAADDYADVLAAIEAGGPSIDHEELAGLVRSAACLTGRPVADPLDLACAVARLAALENAAAEERRKVLAEAPMEAVLGATALMEHWSKKEH